jgi:erythromycin esterase-like protein
MFYTLSELFSHLDSGQAKVVVWAHNCHLGERFGERAFTIGFSTYRGRLPPHRTGVRPPNANVFARPWPAVTRSYFTLLISRVSGLT